MLESVGWEPVALEELVERLSLSLGELMRRLESLEDAGWVARRGAWVERISSHDPVGG